MFDQRSPRVRALLPAALLSAIAGAAGAAPAASAPPAAAPAAADTPSRFTGRWELDLTRLPRDYGPPPRRVLYTFARADAGRWYAAVDITARDGSVRHMGVTYRADGTAGVGEGDTSEADSAALLSPAPDVLIANLARQGAPSSVRVYTLDPGGDAMTESAASVNAQGAPFVRRFHFRRVG
jgi:hypothetical protein